MPFLFMFQEKKTFLYGSVSMILVFFVKSYSYVLLTYFYKNDNEYEYEMKSFSYS